MVFATTVVPENLQWWGLGREVTPGTAVLPTTSIPLDKGQPDNKFTYLQDKSIQGNMAEDQGDVQGVAVGDFPLSGNVYLDTIGHLLFNLFGDYTATGSTPANSTTLNGAVSAGATTCTVTSGTGYAIGQAVQIGITADANPEIVVLTNVAGTTLTFANTPLRFAHATGKTVATVVAPFTHVFSLLNSGFGQPVTHTITHHDGLSANGGRQYPFWCCSGMDFKMTAEQLFTHDTKGTCVKGSLLGSAPTNTQSGLTAEPNWLFKVGVGGPAAGGTLISNIEDASVSLMRNLKTKYTLQAVQDPYVIARLAFGATGKFTYMAQDESPLLAMLNDTVEQLQITMTQGTGGSQVGITFDFQTAKFESVPIQAPDTLCYDVSWRAIRNTTNVGASGVASPGKVTLVNAVATY